VRESPRRSRNSERRPRKRNSSTAWFTNSDIQCQFSGPFGPLMACSRWTLGSPIHGGVPNKQCSSALQILNWVFSTIWPRIQRRARMLSIASSSPHPFENQR
jgi:hypothetical protein